MSFIRGDRGWIVVDPLTAHETAAAGLELLRENVEDLSVSVVIFTHSHADHFGGVKGVITPEEIAERDVPVIAPEGFFEEAVSKNLIAGNTMSRRAGYMYGNLLEKGPEGTLGSGLGTSTAAGTFTIVEITETSDRAHRRRRRDDLPQRPRRRGAGGADFYIPSLRGNDAGGDHQPHDA